MAASVLADIVMLLHFAFIVFVVAGASSLPVRPNTLRALSSFSISRR